MSNSTYVIGVGMTKFEKPQSRQWDYPDMAKEAGEAALADAKLEYSDIQAAVVSYCYGEPTSGQRAIYELGLTGIPVFNVNNNCSSASSALMLARLLVQSGQFQCVMALGFERMERGLSEKYTDRTSPVGKHFDQMVEMGAEAALLPKMNKMTSEVIKLYAYAAREYMSKYPECRAEDFAQIASKNRSQGSQNPKASLYPKLLSAETALNTGFICHPVTIHMSAVTADGSACAVVCSGAYLRQKFAYDIAQQRRAVEILAQHMCTDLPSSFDRRSFISLSGYDMAKVAADKCYREAGITAKDLDVLEVHDCFAPNELLMYEAVGLVPEGTGMRLIRQGRWESNSHGGKVFRMGKWVVNPSGGLESKGHPIGATGLAQCYELIAQLRGEAQLRQVEGAKVALQHNFGIGGAAVVTIYRGQTNVIPTAKL